MSSDPLSDPNVRQLLSLVRASLWQLPADIRPFTDCDVDWNGIDRLAMLQTVGSLAVEGATTLPPHLLPPKEWLRKGYALAELNRRTHRLLDSCVAETFSTLSDAGLHPVLLKGQAYARAYPDHAMRQCGDIDIYVGPDDYHKAYDVARRVGWVSDEEFLPEAKHYGCSLRGVRIELHRTAAQLTSLRTYRRFVEWSLGQLSTRSHTITIGGKNVAVPTPLFDVIFVFMHLFNHFISGGIGLRQICDWTMLLHTRSRDIDRQELERLLKAFGRMRVWRLFTPIAVIHLGLPPEECPFYSPQYSRNAGRILSFIIREGNFGRGVQNKSKPPKGYLSRKVYSCVRYSSWLYSKFRIDPATIVSYHLSFMRDGIRRVITDMQRHIDDTRASERD